MPFKADAPCQPDHQLIEYLDSPAASSFDHLLPTLVNRFGGTACLRESPLHQAVRVLERWTSLVSTHVVMRHQLEKLLDELLPSGYPVVLLKGAAFEGTLYPANEVRPAADIDLLVRPEDFKAVCSSLESRSLRCQTHPGRPYSGRHYFEAQFLLGNKPKILLEVHRNLTQPGLFNIDVGDLFHRAQPHPVWSAVRPRTFVLSPADALLHLALHEFRHLGLRPHSLVELARILELYSPNVQEVMTRAQEFGCARIVLQTMAALTAWLPASSGQPGPKQWAPYVDADQMANVILNSSEIQGSVWWNQVKSLSMIDNRRKGAAFLLGYLGKRALDTAETAISGWRNAGKKK